jgi:hypothetical protein
VTVLKPIQDERYRQLRALVEEGNDGAEIAAHSLFVEYGGGEWLAQAGDEDALGDLFREYNFNALTQQPPDPD